MSAEESVCIGCVIASAADEESLLFTGFSGEISCSDISLLPLSSTRPTSTAV